MINEAAFTHLTEIFMRLDDTLELQWSADFDDHEPIHSLDWEPQDDEFLVTLRKCA